VEEQVGRLLVFESGAVKLQMGDVLLDVAPGNPSAIRQARTHYLTAWFCTMPDRARVAASAYSVTGSTRTSM